jgi:LacI family transcriptional regulator
MFSQKWVDSHMTGKITDVAKKAGVSPATVSRAFARHPYVKENVRKKILATARELNYAPKFSSAGQSVGIMAGGEYGIYMGAYESCLVSSISVELFKMDCNVEITTSRQIPYMHAKTFRSLIVINDKNNDKLPVKGIPVLTVNNPQKGVHSVATDHQQGLELAMDYLVSKGHQKIAFISGKAENWGNTERQKGFIKAKKKHGLEKTPHLFEKVEQSEIIEATAKIMAQKPTAIIIAGEGTAQFLTHALYRLDKKIPEDVSVISFEDENVTPFLLPPHTTISQNIKKLSRVTAKAAVEIADKKYNGKTKNIILQNKLIERESVKDLRQEK